MKYFLPVLLVIASFALWGCGATDQPGSKPESAAAEAETAPAVTPRAIAVLEARSGSTLTGTAGFVQDGDLVTLTLEVENTAPGEHAFHLHEIGDCSAEDGTSAGGHWNPTGADHGQWGSESYHLGDVGNLQVGEDGYGSLTLSTDLWSIGDGGPGEILGRSVIVHAVADDFTTQPTGAAGGRIGCGVIEKAE